MTVNELLIIGLLILIVILLVIILIKIFNSQSNNDSSIEILIKQQQFINGTIEQKINNMNVNLNESLSIIHSTLNNSNLQNEQKLENIRQTLESRLVHLQNENTKKLDEMRNTVDEKLQKTLEERIARSFSLVNERLEQVSKGLGEMSALATGVGDLKKVLTNVKSRGILGEIQLRSILVEILAPNQYLEDTPTYRGSNNRVEFAIKLPNDNHSHVLLPIDSKFPLEDYHRLLDAYQENNPLMIADYSKRIETSIKKFAKEIRDKYIKVPETTDFGILFIPIEGLYAEVVRKGLVEYLQREYKITLAGPTTMSALLNSLQMGFRTLAIQERSNEVWNILAGVKTEFSNFALVLDKHQERLNQANEELDRLVGVRTRKLVSKLNKIESLDSKESVGIGDEV